MMEEDNGHGVAVCLQEVYKSYGRGASKVKVLCGININVPRASIYGLLGPSGCGKTTALRCAVGRLNTDSGVVSTLGKPPNTIGHGVPGHKVGYMPQELALYNEMTVGETLTYFGRLQKMGRKRIQERIEFLLKFLKIPEQSRPIHKLSGGQQRRTSFAIALLHEPELLILDEPTVGVDPLLRQRIWEHLMELAQNGNITIIITTHYIEEARQANKVGLMRSGRLLAEAPPEQLLAVHQKEQLEDVFFALCEQDQGGDIEENDVTSANNTLNSALPAVKPEIRNSVHGNNHLADSLGGDLINTSSTDNDYLIPPREKGEKISWKMRLSNLVPSGWNILALIIKQLTLMTRNKGTLLFEFILPSFQIVLFCICVGRTPFDLEVAVVNAETKGVCPSRHDVACNMTDLVAFRASCCYVSFIDPHTIIQVNYTDDFEAALHSVEKGKCWGVLEMEENFTQALFVRMTSKNKTLDNGTLSASDVHAYLDMTNQQVSYTLQMEIMTSMQKFIEYTLSRLGQNPEKAQMPIKYEDPVYGSVDTTFTNFIAPGIIISITSFMATGLTSMVFVLERKQGLLERSFISGASAVEIMVAHIVTQCLIMCVQVMLLFLFCFVVFKIPYEGPLVLALVLTLMQGLTGMALGMLISALCDEEVSAIQASLGSVYPNMLLSGIIWPLEGMPHWLRSISQVLPMTYAVEAMRSILLRGWNVEYDTVRTGLLVTLAWGWGLMAISAIIFKIKQS